MKFYTDGACSGNPGPGGWAYVCVEGSVIVAAAYDFEENTTNNRMELRAILDVLKLIYHMQQDDAFIKEQHEIVSDSAYAINTITSWMSGWCDNGWTRAKGKPVENLDLVKELYNYYITKNLRCQVTFTKVHGHAGIMENELCDAICSRNKSKYNLIIKKYNIDDSYLFENIKKI